MQLIEKFQQDTLPDNFYWFNEPGKYQTGNGLEIFTDEKTDFWQKTHYGFERDDGHCLFIRLNEDFTITTHTKFSPLGKYDQSGLMLRIDEENWVKMSTEVENEEISRLGSVVTNLGYSDWATRDIPANQDEMWYRISKNGSDLLLENSFDGQKWEQMRITHMHKMPEFLEVGVYACSPIGKDFHCRFTFLEITENTWEYNPE